ncbi:MAG TPA: metallophosphoesterase [Anaerovoracaceae bacterium]|nr:metallophosphoesterase [Anaerovoracaceae bacterium]
MGIYAIADLHLSFSVEKPMDIYGGEWINHTEKVKRNWEALISEKDTVIIPGDSSWALRFEDSLVDLKWISDLPGNKVFMKGNHDLWWNSATKLNALFENMFFLQNSSYEAEGYAICGSRGWICPGDDDFTRQDEKIYLRELGRLRLSLEAAAKAGYGKKAEEYRGNILGALHFPPASGNIRHSGFTDLFEEYGVEKVVYGHLHGKDAYGNGLMGIRNNIEYILTSTDYLRCVPYKIL